MKTETQQALNYLTDIATITMLAGNAQNFASQAAASGLDARVEQEFGMLSLRLLSLANDLLGPYEVVQGTGDENSSA